MWTPWIGSKYEDTRILLLGESNYAWQDSSDGSPQAPGQDHPRLMVEVQFADEQDAGRTMEMLTDALTNNDADSADKRRAGWDQVAFTNYVPVWFANKAGERPDSAAWSLAREQWPDLLEALKPKNVIVFGHECWEAIPKGHQETVTDWEGTGTPLVETYTLSDGQRVTCYRHLHPAARQGASWQTIRRLLDYIRAKEANA